MNSQKSSTNVNNKSRLFYLDSIGGLLLIHMIIGHCAQWSNTYDTYYKYTFWLNFFMPWFFFKNGMFFKKISISEELKKSYHRLIIPYIWFTIAGTCILWFKLSIEDDFTMESLISPIKSILRSGATPGNLPLWFLLSLFTVRFFFTSLISLSESRQKQLLYIGILLSLASFLILNHIRLISGLFIPLYFSNISSGFLFFSLGYVIKKSSFKPSILLVIFICNILIWYIWPSSVDMRSGIVVEGSDIIWVINSLLGIIGFNGLFEIILNRKTILSKIGESTMSYYCIHWIVIVTISIFFTSSIILSVGNWGYFSILVGGNILLLPIITYIIQHSKFAYIIK